MNGSNAVALRMPSNYVPMSNEEMEYVEGGYSIKVDRKYLNKSTCNTTALYYTSATGLSQSVIAHEIYAHTVLYYASKIGTVSGKTAVWMGGIYSFLGGVTVAACNYIANHANPIDLGGGSRGCADSRQWIFDLIWKGM